MRRTRLLAWLLLAAVFLLGGIGGAAVTVLFITKKLDQVLVGLPRNGLARTYRVYLGRRLHLSTAQEQEVERIVLEGMPEAIPLWRSIEPQLAQQRARRHEKIRAILRADQQATFDSLIMQLEKSRQADLAESP